MNKSSANTKFQLAVLDFDLERFLDESGHKYVRTSGDQLVLNCPFCGASNKFYIGAKNKLFICFKCEERGNVVKLVSALGDIDTKNAIKRIYGKLGGTRLDKINSSILDYRRIRHADDGWMVEPDYDFAPSITSFSSNNAIHYYLNERGIDAEMVSKFNLRYSQVMQRLVFPLYTETGADCGWVARDITGTHYLRYLNSSGLKKSKILYGINLHWNRDSVVLVEGPVDAIKCHKVGGVALLGKSISVEQRNILLSLSSLRRVYIGIDPDQPICAREVGHTLAPFFEVYLVNFDSYRDLGDRKTFEVERLIQNATPLLTSKFSLDFETGQL